MKFQKGQKVKLTSYGVKAIMSTGGAQIRARVVDWNKRSGTITRVTALKQIVVTWDGNKSASDALHPSILELAG